MQNHNENKKKFSNVFYDLKKCGLADSDTSSESSVEETFTDKLKKLNVELD